VAYRLLATLLAGSGALHILTTRAPYYSTETGTFRDTAAVTLFLRDHLQPGDKVITEHPSAEALLYYFRRYGVPPDYRDRDYRVAERLYIVVNTEYPQTVASVLANNGLRLEAAAAVPVQQFPLATIYRLEPPGH
jgi:DNA-binding transcriptional MocR family regulator